MDVSLLDDEELVEQLKLHGLTPGPVVGSTRKFYEKKLTKLLNDIPSEGYRPPPDQEVDDDDEDEDAHLDRLGRLADRFYQRTRQIMQHPEEASSFAMTIANNFARRNVTSPRQVRTRETRGRPTNVLSVKFICLRNPTTNTTSRLNYEELRRYGLGEPPPEYINGRGFTQLPLIWTGDDVVDFINRMYPVLSSTNYQLCRVQCGGRLYTIPDTVRSPVELRDLFLEGRARLPRNPSIYIRPIELITHQPLGTPTILSRVPDATTSTTAESVEETRCLRQQQDAEYNESLRVDQEIARQRRLVERREARLRRYEEQRNNRLIQLREMRRDGIPEEPNDGLMVRFRYPGGSTSTRRFSPDMGVEALICTAGSDGNSTEDFYIHLPGIDRPIHSSASNATLREVGICVSTAVDVAWIDESTNNSVAQAVSDYSSVLQPVSTQQEQNTPATQTQLIATNVSMSPQTIVQSNQDVIVISPPSTQPIASPSSSQQDPSAPSTSVNTTATESQQERQSTIDPELLICVNRETVDTDLINVFNQGDIINQHIRIQVNNENAVDEDGVFRDVLTAFWSRVIDRYFEGESQAAPVVSPSVTPEMWTAVGRIFLKGFLQVGYLPLRFSLASLIYAVFGRESVSNSLIIECWLKSLGGYDRQLMQRVLSGDLEPEDTDDVIDVLDRYSVTTRPNQSNISSLAVRCAEVTFFERAAFPLMQMNLEQLSVNQALQTPQLMTEYVHNLQPNGRRVANLLRAEPTNSAQQTALRYLIQAVRSFDNDLLCRFLRFVSGSDVINFEAINVQFSSLYGLERRCVSHTCSVTLDLPVSYTSFNEFLMELKNQLMSDFWEMEFA